MSSTAVGHVRPRPTPAPPVVGARRWRHVPLLVWAASATVYAVVAVQRHRLLLTTGFDLGIFEQALRGYAHLQAPIASLKGPGVNVLGDHFSPAMALLAPAYRLAPTPATLLVAQAILLTSPVLPLGRWALATAGRMASLAVMTAVVLSFGLVQALAFDVHEVMWAVPLLAWSCVCLGQRRWRAAVMWAVPLVLVKEDLGLTLAAVGLVVLLGGRRRLGLAAIVGGLGATVLEMGVLVPWVNAGHHYDYLAGATGGRADLATLLGLAGNAADLSRWNTFLLLLAPTLALAVRSPLLLVAAPTIGWRLLTTNPAYASPYYHYNAVLVPIVLAAFVDGLLRWRRAGLTWTPARQRVVVGTGLAVALVLGAQFSMPVLGSIDDPVRETAADRLRADLDVIPSGATVAATNDVVPQLVADHDVTLLGQANPATTCPAWIVRTLPGGSLTGHDWPLTTDQLDDAAPGLARYYTAVVSDRDKQILRWSGSASPSTAVALLPGWECTPP